MSDIYVLDVALSAFIVFCMESYLQLFVLFPLRGAPPLPPRFFVVFLLKKMFYIN